ncbi:MAG: ROK family transcriptional regulator [Pseudomonadota bacterium]
MTRPTAPVSKMSHGKDRFDLVSASRIGEANKRRVLQTLFDRGPTSRADLARLSGTNRTTISGIVQPLIDNGLLVEEAPSVQRSVGKPPRPLWFSPEAAPVCAVTLMPNRVQSAIVSITGEILQIEEEATYGKDSNREDFVSALKACISGSLASSSRPPLGIGIAVGGMVDMAQGNIVTVNLAPALSGLNLVNLIESEFHLPTIIDHHPRAILLGERWFGQGRGLKNFAVIYTGEVLGCALYLNDALFRGPLGSGGELGHIIVDIDGDLCTCGKHGCWETVATLPWLRKTAKAMGLPGARHLNTRALCDLADAGDETATELMNQYARNLAVGIANLQTLLMPSDFILYGDIVEGSAQLHDRIEADVKLLSPRHPGGKRHVICGSEEEKTTLRGAAGLVISEQLQIEY